MMILAFSAGIQIFVEPYLLAFNPSAFGLTNNWALNQLAYELAFRGSNLAAASALSFILLVICLVLALFVIYRTDFFDEVKFRKKRKAE
jgi:multiple sugar transport system permease protein